jgi:hypothetical protein
MYRTGYRGPHGSSWAGSQRPSRAAASGPAAQPSAYSIREKGQTGGQRSRDTAECQAWAQQQMGFDSLSAGGRVSVRGHQGASEPARPVKVEAWAATQLA